MLEQWLNTKTILGLFVIAALIYLVAGRVKEHREIVRLGGYAPGVRSFVPLGKNPSLRT